MNPPEPAIAFDFGVDQPELAAVPDPRKPINVASVKHRSPFRYPGGKTWLVPHIRRWLRSLRSPIERLVEPFAGGAIVSLSALLDGLVSNITLIERDTNVGAVWQTISTGGAMDLAKRIMSFDLTEESVHHLLEKELDSTEITTRAFVTIVRNRVQRGGILAPGAGLVKTGENGRGIRSRWYPETLRNRLLDLHQFYRSIEFQMGDGIEYMRSHADMDLVWFIDPPYAVAGRRLYVHSDVDHAELFRVTASLAGRFLMTYDDSAEVRKLAADHGFQVAEVAMKNTHHSLMKELLISSDLRWLNR